jgi:GrpB-like predicted nucleotidyltransferase (UPF0157 family)
VLAVFGARYGATMREAELVLRFAYRAFNARDVEAALELMHPEVDWPNAWEGSRVVGRAAVRDYWNRQFAAISSNVQPLRFTRELDGGITVDVHRVVRDAHSGELLLDSCVRHRYKLEDGLVARMDVLESDLPHSRSGSAGDAATPWSDEPVRIVPYDSDWPARFEEERALLASAIGDWAVGGIHHVGSTSVPGLDSKPVIDILTGVSSLEESRACFDQLAGLDYLYAPYRTHEMHWFCKPHPSRRTHHLHLVPTTSARFRDELAFRDYLRDHRDVAQEYGVLKRRLAEKFEQDREAYTDAKTDFIIATLRHTADQPDHD